MHSQLLFVEKCAFGAASNLRWMVGLMFGGQIMIFVLFYFWVSLDHLGLNTNFVYVIFSFSFVYTLHRPVLHTKNNRLSWCVIAPHWKGLQHYFWKAKYLLFSLVQKRMCWLCGWQDSTQTVFWLQDRWLICNGKQSSHGNAAVLVTHFELRKPFCFTKWLLVLSGIIISRLN